MGDASPPTLALWVKRVIDVAGALFGLLLFSPLLMFVTVVILFADGPPVLRRVRRMGRDGDAFSLLKFRTLRDTEDGPTIAPEDDPRITRTGLWLRRWRLDEFPQLVNVLKGEMSLVGPRPMPPAHVDALPEQVRVELLSLRPGLTDPAAIHFLAEDVVLAGRVDAESLYMQKLLPVKAQMQIEYIRSWSLFGDLRVVALTAASLWSPAQRQRSALALRRILE